MRGLTNDGTYCSINSVVQCLYQTRELQDAIRDVDDRDCRASNRVAVMLKRLIQEMTKDNHLPCNASFLVHAMSAYNGVSYDTQEDSDLVFKCIINALADSNGPASKIGTLWDIEKETRVRCLNCNTVQSSLNRSNAISVIIKQNLPDDLQSYIDQYSDITLTTCDYHCKECHTKTQVEITTRVLSLPPVVCMKIERVQNIGRDIARIVKTGKRFSFPETLDLKYMKEPTVPVDTVYDLYAVVAHNGTPYCGHYTAYVREDGSWYLADDTYFKSCSWEDVKTTYESGTRNGRIAYMLMYRRNTTNTVQM